MLYLPIQGSLPVFSSHTSPLSRKTHMLYTQELIFQHMKVNQTPVTLILKNCHRAYFPIYILKTS